MSFKFTKTEDSSDNYISEDDPTPEKPSRKMSDKVTLNVLTKFIKPYKGDRESLPAFLTNCDNAISLASTDQQNVLCKYILSQLEGKAQLASSLKSFDKWSDIKSFLKSTFGEKKHSTHLLVDLQNCKQGPSEDVVQYSLRVETCLIRLQSDIHYSCSDQKELVGRIAAMEDLALNTFLLGLNSNFSHIVRCRNPKSLSDAITQATEEEKLFKLTKLSSRSIKQCTICNKSGHSSNECYKNKNKHFSPNLHNLNLSDNNYNKNSNFNSSLKKSCAYCKKLGHVINECRKLKYKNSQSASNSSAQPSASANAPSSDRPKFVHTVDVAQNDSESLN